MKITRYSREEGSILMVVFITVTILTLICAVSLNITTQNANSTTQTTSWQQSLSGAEAAADQGMNALNTNSWAGWYTVTGAIPWTQPTPGATPFPSATAAPTSGHYNYYIPPAITLQGEANNTIKTWVAIDPVPEKNNIVLGPSNQPYRIRAIGIVGAPGPARVSNSRLDNDLRKIALQYDRFTGTAIVTPQAARRIELVAYPVQTSFWTRAITLGSWISMSGGGTIDSFDSTNPLKSTGGLYDPTKKQNNAGIGLVDSTGSDLKNTNVWGSIQYSGPAIKNTGNVHGQMQSPYNATLPTTVDPVNQPSGAPWYDSTKDAVQSQPFFVSGNYTNYGGGSLPFALTAGGTASNPTFVKISADYTVSAGKVLNISAAPPSGQTEAYLTIWVAGKFTTSGSGIINQDAHAHVIWIVDNDITTSGDSYNNLGGQAANVTFVGVGAHKVTCSGGSSFIGTVNAPAAAVTVSGTGSFVGAIIANTLTISGGASFHYDEALALNSSGTKLSNYAYASWFEDNSDPSRGILQ